MSNYYIKVSAIGVLLSCIVNISWAKSATKSEHVGFILANQQKGAIKILNEYGQPLWQAKIYAENKELIGVTDEQGLAQLESLVAGSRLLISYPGYYPKTFLLGELSEITLVPQYLENRDTLTVLYENKPKNDLLGSVDVVYNNQLVSTPTPLYINALTGRLSGLYTQELNGFRSARNAAITSLDLAGSLPTDATKYSSNLSDNTEMLFQLRGQNPVTLIDGVQRDIYSIDPENIESITVIKDALSAIMLGQRSSRGILQVTTKKGKVGPPRISFTAQTGFQEAVKRPEPLQAYQFAYLYNEALANSGRQPVYS
ncbi:MAG: TonB-dependent receptor plug domain-containing protein, partial [Sphingobacterium sp.]